MAPELAILQAVVRWKEHNEKNVEELEQVLEHIRLSELSPQVIFNEVEPMKLFSHKRILTAVRLQYRPSITETQPRGRKGVLCVNIVWVFTFAWTDMTLSVRTDMMWLVAWADVWELVHVCGYIYVWQSCLKIE